MRPETTRDKTSIFRFSIQKLLLFIAGCAVCLSFCATLASSWDKQHRLYRSLREFDGEVYFRNFRVRSFALSDRRFDDNAAQLLDWNSMKYVSAIDLRYTSITDTTVELIPLENLPQLRILLLPTCINNNLRTKVTDQLKSRQRYRPV
jgi:hypothetical protein